MRARHRPGRFMAFAIAALAAGCSPAEPAAESEPTVGVTVQAVRRASMRDAATASGLVVPSTAGEWTIYAPAPAQIARLPVKETDTVAAGDVLVQFEVESITRELDARQADVTEATARADRARTEFVRMNDLFQRGIASRNAYEAARGEQTTAASILAQAVSHLEAVKLQSAQSTIRARFAGVVTRVNHREGEFVSGSPTDPILQVIDPSRLQVAAHFPIPQLARIVQGQTATVLAIGGEGPLEATVASKPTTVDANAPTGEVRLAFVGPSTLAVNAPVSVEILLDQRQNALVVPAAAVLRDDLSAYVMVAGDDGRAHRRDVRTGLVTDALVEVLSGVEPEMRVIVGGIGDVSEGSLVVYRE